MGGCEKKKAKKSFVHPPAQSQGGVNFFQLKIFLKETFLSSFFQEEMKMGTFSLPKDLTNKKPKK